MNSTSSPLRVSIAAACVACLLPLAASAQNIAVVNGKPVPKQRVDNLIAQLSRLPGVGTRTAQRLAFHILRVPTEEAFALADEANAASRRLLRYDAKAHRARCARIRYAFPKALYDHRTGRGHESTLPVFVVGMPRSGTTLVEQILAGHSRIHGAGELGVVPRVIAGLERWERHTGSGRGYPDCVDDLDPPVTRRIAEINAGPANWRTARLSIDSEGAYALDYDR